MPLATPVLRRFRVPTRARTSSACRPLYGNRAASVADEAPSAASTRSRGRWPGCRQRAERRTVWAYLPHRLLGRRVVFNTDGLDWKRRKWGCCAVVPYLRGQLLARAQDRLRTWCRTPRRCSGSTARSTAPRASSCHNGGHVRGVGLCSSGGADRQLGPACAVEPGRVLPARSAASSPADEPWDGGTRVSRSAKSTVPLAGRRRRELRECLLRAAQAASEDPRVLVDVPLIYEPCELIEALFLGARAYIHGHEVGGTNPWLVTAMGCGQARARPRRALQPRGPGRDRA